MPKKTKIFDILPFRRLFETIEIKKNELEKLEIALQNLPPGARNRAALQAKAEKTEAELNDLYDAEYNATMA